MFRAYGSLPNCEDASLFLRNPLDAVSWVSPLMMGTTADSSGTLKAAAKENFHFTLGCNLDNRPLELNEIVENDLFHEDTIKGMMVSCFLLFFLPGYFHEVLIKESRRPADNWNEMKVDVIDFLRYFEKIRVPWKCN